ncbi:hypothetical protein [Pedobacter heparinus]|uniref:hypothetical protein n=1 Tax=Pedobacter heparinus TaxID=984 RepID=UPI00292FFCC9|nr:hypothetical protein [Pedobacter heparinus]
MGNKKFNTFLGILILVLVVWMLKGTFMQPGISSLKGGFTEIAHYRNDNNTGPIQHVFAVTVKDTSIAELEAYGNFMPHHKGGNTKVYFFAAGNPVPDQLNAGNVNFDPNFDQYCIALYEKTAMGNASVQKNPFQ